MKPIIWERTPNAAPLDLDSFAGFTPRPWTLQMGDEQNPFNGIVRDSKGHILVKRATMNYEDGRDMALLAAAPALLSECRRLRAENERLRSGLTECVQFLSDRQDPDDTDEDHLISFARAALEPQS